MVDHEVNGHHSKAPIGGRRHSFSRMVEAFYTAHIDATDEEKEELKANLHIPPPPSPSDADGVKIPGLGLLNIQKPSHNTSNESKPKPTDKGNHKATEKGKGKATTNGNDDASDSSDGEQKDTGDANKNEGKQLRRACDRCRAKHIGCLVVPGKAKCENCEGVGARCVFGVVRSAIRTPSR